MLCAWDDGEYEIEKRMRRVLNFRKERQQLRRLVGRDNRFRGEQDRNQYTSMFADEKMRALLLRKARILLSVFWLVMPAAP